MSQTKIDIDMEKCDAELKSKTIVGFLDNKEPGRDETLMMQWEWWLRRRRLVRLHFA